ncbi:threonine/serine exporter family protein [Stieleria maiorica]|nr:threonine/serine exporter family protein [Stieleria maiorica]
MGNSLKSAPSQTFLIDAAMMLHRFGTPSHRLERVMGKVAVALGIHGEFLYTPTALVISLRDSSGEEMTVIRRVDSGPVNVDKLIRFDELLSRVERRETSVDAAMEEMKQIEQAKALYGPPVYIVACAVACAAVAVFFSGTPWEIALAGLVGALVAGIELLYEHWGLELGLLELLAGVVAATSSLLVACYVVPIDHRLVTLAGLIILIPGLRLTVALTELAVGHLSAGVARLSGALVSLATLFVGAILVWRLLDRFQPQLGPRLPVASDWQWVALAVAPIAFAIVFRAGWRQWPIIGLVSVLGVVVSWATGPRYGIEVASFLGALSVGCGSNLYARIRDIPALVALTPGMLILVPGSLGYRSLSALSQQQTVEAVQYGFEMIVIASSLVGGLIVSNVIISPKRIL